MDLTRPHYMPQLDGIRGIAVFGVFVVHWFPHDHPTRQWIDTGEIGVRMFFVLSGFLIAKILLECRTRLVEGRGDCRQVLLSFYARRVLRLFPAYFLYLAATSLLIPGVTAHLGWFLTYSSNLLFAMRPEIFSRFLAHTWTLAIEEQFYLVVPFILMLVPTRMLFFVAIGSVFAAFVFRGTGLGLGFTRHQVGMMVPAQIDVLGAGVLLALIRAQSGAGYSQYVISNKILVVGLTLEASLLVAARYGLSDNINFLFFNTAMAMCFIWLVDRGSVGFSGWLGNSLQCSPMIFVGKISYGLYLFHFNVPGLYDQIVFPKLGWCVDNHYVRFLLFAATSLLIASVSWYSMERPILRLKKYFPYFSNSKTIVA